MTWAVVKVSRWMVMAEAFPKSRFIGIDISDGVIEKARSVAEEKGFQNISFQKRDAALLREERGTS